MADPNHKFDYVVSVMFENRSFDNLFGRLYEPGEVASFEGVAGKDLSPFAATSSGAECRDTSSCSSLGQRSPLSSCDL
jgi:hypothetical protein